jgi:lipopolysaccharide transport system ATP-binding protein
MSDTVIRVENLSKKYIIRHQQAQQYTALRDVIADGVKSIGRRLSGAKQDFSMGSTQEEFWALKDVSFEVKQGDRVGIIGRNGAGKSTLLKILSRITEPTTGEITLNGRVASLLEVGTGFHPELTGRENIFLNGAILGMSKMVVKRRFDEIVEFSEVEKFLDTPVKQYSSGMYVRLAFAVAAHLESEILIIDEVLAVGDIKFQRRCLSRIEDISKSGRTILFVSHNVSAIRSSCDRALNFSDGQLILDSDIESAINSYLSEDNYHNEGLVLWNLDDLAKSQKIEFEKAYILNDQNIQTSVLDCKNEFSIVLEYKILEPMNGLRIGFFIQTSEGIPICGSNDPDAWPKIDRVPGKYVSKCFFPGNILNWGKYNIRFGADIPPSKEPLIRTPFCLNFKVEDTHGHGVLKEKLPGIIRPRLKWQVFKK